MYSTLEIKTIFKNCHTLQEVIKAAECLYLLKELNQLTPFQCVFISHLLEKKIH